MKKAFCLIMAVTMVFGTMLCGCGRMSDAEVGDETKDGVIGDGNNNANDTMDFMNGGDTVGSSNGGAQSAVDDINGYFNTDGGTANNGSATNNNGSGSGSGSSGSGSGNGSGSGSTSGSSNGSGSGVTEYTTVAPSNRGRGSGSNDMGQSLRSGR